MKVVFVSTLFNPRKGNRGHSVPLHAGLVAAAASAGHDAVILAPREFVPRQEGHVVPVLTDRKNAQQVSIDLQAYIRSEIGDQKAVVLHYEGDTSTVDALDNAAAGLPRVMFVVNLFSPEPEFVVPSRPPRSWRDALIAGRRGTVLGRRDLSRALPDNMVLLADTDRRMLIGRSLGLPIAGVWPLHSQLSDPTKEFDAVRASNPQPRILVPISARVSDAQLIREVRAVIRSSREAGAEIDWAISGALASKPKKERDAKRTLGRLADVRTQAHEVDDYADQFLRADVVWMPSRRLYDAQSSGKALDALASGCVLLSPSMSYGYREQMRWVPGVPTYSSVEEATDLFVRLASFLPESRREMDRLSPQIREAYSARSAFSRLMSFASREGDEALP